MAGSSVEVQVMNSTKEKSLSISTILAGISQLCKGQACCLALKHSCISVLRCLYSGVYAQGCANIHISASRLCFVLF